jgi:hypothetical protein
MHPLKKYLRAIIMKAARWLGSEIVDHQTGKVLGRALLLPWRGKIHVIGLRNTVKIIFAPQQRLTYWKQEIVFTVHPAPDFSHEARAQSRCDASAC